MDAKLIDYMGSDLTVVRAAKVSFADDAGVQEFIDRQEAATRSRITGETIRSHEALIDYLAAHNHWTPFGHPQITLRMSAPVPIRTQMFKHKIGFVENEESRRYIKSRPALFIPDEFRAAPDGDKVKQGSNGAHPADGWIRKEYVERCTQMIDYYESLIEQGVAPEQARFVLPQGCEVNWYWTGSLYAFAKMFNGRQDSHAQGEAQDLSSFVGDIIQPLFPYSWRALTGK